MKRQRTTPYYIYSAALTLLLALALAACGHGHQQRLLQLEELERQNRADSLMTNDSLALALTQYFDRHGTPNEQMRAHYMLGRTYYDRGELPQALDAYHEAAARADTTAQDCDYRTLCRVHAQTAQLFYSQYLPTSQIPLERNAAYYAQKANDTLSYIASISMEAEAYSLLENTDSALILFETAFNLYMQKQLTSMAANLCCSMAELYCKKAEYQTARRYLDIYERKSDYFDNNGNVESGKEIYYYIKGLYYLEIGRLDSAEYFFRKELTVSTDFVNQFAARKGLLSLYVHKSNTDSIRKYMALADSLSDSSHLYLEMQTSLHLNSLYDYTHHKQMALQKTIEASRSKSALQTVAIFFLILVVACILLSALYLILTTKYRHAQDNLVQAQLDMALLRSENKEILEKKEKDIAYYRQEVCNYQKSLFWLNKMSLNERLQKSVIAKRLISMASNNPPIQASSSDFFQLEKLIDKEIPTFKDVTRPCQDDGLVLGYRMCLLIRAGFGPTDISKLMGISPSSVTKMRIRLLKLIFHREGRAEDFDEAIRTLSN